MMFMVQESEKGKVTVVLFFFWCTVVQNGSISDSRKAGLAAGVDGVPKRCHVDRVCGAVLRVGSAALRPAGCQHWDV